MSDIYTQHDAAFRAVSAFVILRDGERVATVAIKHATAVTAYVHLVGVEMVKGVARGGGYDRASAAAATAIGKIPVPSADHDDARYQTLNALRMMLRLAATGMDAGSWTRELERQGFRVLQAV